MAVSSYGDDDNPYFLKLRCKAFEIQYVRK